MIMEIIIGAIGAAFIALVVFVIITLNRLRKTLKAVDRTITDVHYLLDSISEPTVELIDHVNKLTADIAKKSEGLDVLFRPLYAAKKEKSAAHDGYEKMSQIIGCVAEGIRIFSKIKNEIK